MSLAHCLTEVNILSKFNVNPSCGKGDMKQTQYQRLKLVTLDCYLDLESALNIIWILHIISVKETFNQSLIKTLPGIKEYRADKNSRLSNDLQL